MEIQMIEKFIEDVKRIQAYDRGRTSRLRYLEVLYGEEKIDELCIDDSLQYKDGIIKGHSSGGEGRKAMYPILVYGFKMTRLTYDTM